MSRVIRCHPCGSQDVVLTGPTRTRSLRGAATTYALAEAQCLTCRHLWWSRVPIDTADDRAVAVLPAAPCPDWPATEFEEPTDDMARSPRPPPRARPRTSPERRP